MLTGIQIKGSIMGTEGLMMLILVTVDTVGLYTDPGKQD